MKLTDVNKDSQKQKYKKNMAQNYKKLSTFATKS